MNDQRITYQLGSLDVADVDEDPIAQFRTWYEEARETKTVIEAAAMSVASVGPDGMPSSRIVLLRGYDERGFVFFTNYESRKGRELIAHPKAAVLFHWAPLERQIRIEGSVTQIDAAESDTYFARRPRGHRLSAWASQQSAPVAGRAALEQQMAQADARFPDDVPRPPYWGGFRVTPRELEFWQGRPNRVHDRIVYTRDAGNWKIERLSP